MEMVIHRAQDRGHANHGWLDTHHSFSFAGYYNPERMRFGLLRVLNDDIVDPGMGFVTHPHDNMEIISIPIKGALRHTDSMGHTMVIGPDDVQVMSAGSGIRHSEHNDSREEPVNFLQIWIFPKEKDIDPRYDQKTFKPVDRKNEIVTIVSPENNGEESLWINQDAWLSMAAPEKGKGIFYNWQDKSNGVYLFVIKGSVTIGEKTLNERDGMGITDTEQVEIQVEEDSDLLFIEVPMN